MVFSRKLELNGEFSKHYGRNLRGVSGYNLPTPEVEAGVLAFGQSDTVANSLHQARSPRCGRGGRLRAKARSHIASLDTTSIINSGVKNCDVMVQDVARAVAIYGPSIAALR